MAQNWNKDYFIRYFSFDPQIQSIYQSIDSNIWSRIKSFMTMEYNYKNFLILIPFKFTRLLKQQMFELIILNSKFTVIFLNFADLLWFFFKDISSCYMKYKKIKSMKG